MSKYKDNKSKARTFNTDPTATDQASAKDADINIIVGRFVKTGSVPGASVQPMYGDFSELPTSLAEFISTARTIKDLKRSLPAALQDKSTEELLALTPSDIAQILTPADTNTQKEEPK